MALSWNIDTTEDIDFDSFVEYFVGLGDDLFEKEMDTSALMMRRIANNRTFLTDRLNKELESVRNLQAFQSGNVYTPQTFILNTQKSFFVRVNIWAPPRQKPGEGLFFYDTGHDHNFSFLTVGYFGSGYRTQIHEYDPSTLIGYATEPVKLRYLEDTKLPFGKVMYFRQNIDIHTQLPPDEFSISLNVLKKPVEPRTDQYFFDAQSSRCLGKADKHPMGLLIRLAGAVGDERSVDLLKDLIATSASRRARLAAYETVSALSSPTVWEQALKDGDVLVRTVARQRLEALQGAGASRSEAPTLQPQTTADAAE
jgi:hypothetical protein